MPGSLSPGPNLSVPAPLQVPGTTEKSTLALWPPRRPPILPGILLSSRTSWGNRGGRRSPRCGGTCARPGTCGWPSCCRWPSRRRPAATPAAYCAVTVLAICELTVVGETWREAAHAKIAQSNCREQFTSHAYTECRHVAQCFALPNFGAARHDDLIRRIGETACYAISLL